MPSILSRAKPFLKHTIQILIRKKRPVLLVDPTRPGTIGYNFAGDRGKPIDRYYIEKFLAAHSQHITGHALEIASSDYIDQFGTNITQKDILHATHDNPQATIIADLTQPTAIPQNQFDCFICTQTLNFIFDIQSAIESSHRLLKPGGTFIGTVSAISHISRYDYDRWGDYWRFTDTCLRKLLQTKFKNELIIENFGNPLTATAFLQCLAVEDITPPHLLDDKHPDYPVTIGFLARK